jgi:glucose/mannose transport system permease protein
MSAVSLPDVTPALDAGATRSHRSRFPGVARIVVWAVLLLAAFFFVVPLYVMLATAFKDADEIRNGNLLALPAALNFVAWRAAWSSACTGVDCNGLQPFFWNSVAMTVPAVLVSTAWGAVNGYVLSLWRFRGSELLFSLLLFGVFMPFQVVLLPMSQVLGMLGLSSSIAGLVLVHVLAGLPSTTLFFRNYYAAVPRELLNAARIDGAGFWQIFWRVILPLSTPIVMVTLIWQFTAIWNDFLFGVAFSGTESKPVTVGLNNLANTSSSVKSYNVDMAAAIIAGLPTMALYVLAGKYFVRGLTAGAVKG